MESVLEALLYDDIEEYLIAEEGALGVLGAIGAMVGFVTIANVIAKHKRYKNYTDFTRYGTSNDKISETITKAKEFKYPENLERVLNNLYSILSTAMRTQVNLYGKAITLITDSNAEKKFLVIKNSLEKNREATHKKLEALEKTISETEITTSDKNSVKFIIGQREKLFSIMKDYYAITDKITHIYEESEGGSSMPWDGHKEFADFMLSNANPDDIYEYDIMYDNEHNIYMLDMIDLYIGKFKVKMK